MDFRYYEIPEDRKLRVLDSVIRLYTERADPVSSSAVARDLQHRWSASTVRNVFTELEELGWLAQPHRSSGRVPTNLGYRTFVEKILRGSGGDRSWERRLRGHLDLDSGSLSPLLAQAAELLSRVSHALGMSVLVFSPASGLDAEKVRITGIDQLLQQPEFEDPRRLKVLIHLLDDVRPFDDYLRNLADHPGRIRLRIGEENTLADLDQFTLVTTRIDRSRESALVALLGPVRMEYPLVLGAMQSLVRLLNSESEENPTWS
jgi:transcriptional regulator of heat shock response